MLNAPTLNSPEFYLSDAQLLQAFQACRAESLQRCATLEIEDYGLQAEAFTSPPKWHLAHTTWFFETFILVNYVQGYRCVEPAYTTLFNSYYNGVGKPFSRHRRGLLSRPALDDVLAYRERIDTLIEHLIVQDHPAKHTIAELVYLGIQHEQQHQELLWTDIHWSLYENPLLPAMDKAFSEPLYSAASDEWQHYEGGLVNVGFSQVAQGFCFDNELPHHQTYLAPYALKKQLVTNAEYQWFIDDGGYQRSELWLADGWATVQAEAWQAPHFWLSDSEYTLAGLKPRKPDAPVRHLSGYEADAYATWADARLPSEHEWEHAANTQALDDMFGHVWQWTGSAYRPYPGFKIADGAIGEYNGKFMCNQWVLKGSSIATPNGHSRQTYRNFFYPQDRWQFSGVRLAKSL